MDQSKFLQKALEQLSSPEQLDQMLQITAPKYWIMLLAVLLLICLLAVWSVEGVIRTKAEGTGILIRPGGVAVVDSEGNGIVTKMVVHLGDKVSVGDVIAEIDQPILQHKVENIQQQIIESQADNQQSHVLRTTTEQISIESLERQRATTQQEIDELNTQADVTKTQIAEEKSLLSQGLVTKNEELGKEQELIAIQDRILEKRSALIGIDAQESHAREDPRIEDMTRKMQVANLQRDRSIQQKQLVLSHLVRSQYAGEVVELKVVPGSQVVEGQGLLSLQPEENALQLVAFVDSLKAKDVTANAEVEISPSTVKREEFGYLVGSVRVLSQYPATRAAIMSQLQNEALAASLSSTGPVTELDIALRQDPSSFSGFAWSAKRGPDVHLTSGTLCTVQVVTREQRPLDLIFPFIKKAWN